ncbi:MAG: cyclic pyranopterin monophosphate synthase MoaC [Halobacteriota archaeon]|nr:cyclic pyranopterin monophosphate synthase MoaC [Halobacteriota archaeon]MDY6958747.1 cyclic pyranopterin monophosphate synthase MoaC [Halobacteriota archaeon]
MFTHIKDGKLAMVDISEKDDQLRRATASGNIRLKSSTIDAIKDGNVEKGNVLESARLAAVMAVKNTPGMIPLCHQIPITGIDVDFKIDEDIIEVIVTVKSVGKTGVEMDALCGASVALLTIWDMVKSAEKDASGNYPATRISEIKVVEKVKI